MIILFLAKISLKKGSNLKIILNGKQIEASSLAEILAGFKGHIAVVINDEIVSKALWNSTILKDGDKIEIIELVGGG